MKRYSSLKFLLLIFTVLFVIGIGIFAYLFTSSDSTPKLQKNPKPNHSLSETFDYSLLSADATRIANDQTIGGQVTQLMNALHRYELKNSTVFSFQEWYRQQDLDVSPIAQSVVASKIYEISLNLGLQVGERYTHLKFPQIMKPGYDVEIVNEQKDLTIRNPFRYSIQFQWRTNEDSAYLDAYANTTQQIELPKILIERKTVPYEQVLLDPSGSKRKNVNLPQSGVDGLIVKVFALKDGEKTIISRDYYPAQAKVKLQSSVSD